MIPALPPPGPWLPAFGLLAALMVGANLFVIVRLFPRGGTRPTLATAILLLGILLMSMGLWFAGIYAVLSPGDASTVSVFIAVNSMMAVVGVWAISLLFRAGQKPLPAQGSLWPLGFALLLVGNELLMGLTFVLAVGGPSSYAAQGWSGLAGAVGDAASSVWFFWAMLATMVGLVARLPLPRPDRALLFGFAAASAVGPWVVPDPIAGAVGMAAVMGVTFGLLAGQLRARPVPSVRYLRFAMGVSAGFLAMAGGAGLTFLLRGSADGSVAFGLLSFTVMAAELFLLGRWGLRGGPSVPADRTPGRAWSEAATPSSGAPP